MKRFFCLLLIVCFGATGPEASPPPDSDTLAVTVLPDSIVVTANRFGMNKEQSVWPVTIVSKIDLSYQTSLTEAVDGKAGIDIRNYNGVGSVSTLSSWGLFNRHMLLLYNGRVVKDYSLGGFNLADYSSGEISRIEILKGSQSAFYGADAVGGVVNLITASPMVDNLEISSKQGSFDYKNYQVSYSKRFGVFGFGGYGEFTESDNNRDNAGVERKLYNLNGSYISPDNRHLLKISGRYFDDSLGVPGPVPSEAFIPEFGSSSSSSLYDHQKDENYSLDAQYRYFADNNNQLQFDLFWEKKNIDYNYRYSDYFTGLTVNARSIANKRSSGINGRYLRNLKNLTIAGGIDWLSGSVKATTDDRFADNNLYAYNFWSASQDQYDVWTNVILKTFSDLNLDLSGRMQLVEKRRSQPSYNLGLNYKVNDIVSIKYGYAYAFRLPTISEQYSSEIFTAGNEDLHSETSRSHVLSLTYHVDNKITNSVTFFRQSVDSLIQYQANENFIYVPVNIEKFKTTGMEINSTVKMNEFFSLNFSGVYQKAEQSQNSGSVFAQANYIPEIKWRLDINGQQGKVDYNFNLSYTSNRTAQLYDGLKTIARVYEAGISFGYRITDNLKSHFIVYDLTDENRPDQFGFSVDDYDYPSLGRRIIIGLSYKM